MKHILALFTLCLFTDCATPHRRITDESFRGPLGLLQGTFIPTKLHRLHQIWLEELKKISESRTKTAKP